MASIQIEQLSKSYGDTQVVQSLSLNVAEGEFLVLVGPSGCGKSTLLRIIAGLLAPTSGRILIDGKDVTQTPPGERDIAFVFQSYALYPHMTVFENIAFPLQVRKCSNAEIDKMVAEVAGTLGLTQLLQRLPKDLSGGQRQRVAMGRAIVRKPKVFLFDEPLSNLDAALRTKMRSEIAELHRRMGITTVYVTHNQHEAMTLADRLVLLNGGNIEQQGKPAELFNQPCSRFVGEFLGSPPMNFLPLSRNKQGHWQSGTLTFHPERDPQNIANQDKNIALPSSAWLGVRPEGLSVVDEAVAHGGSQERLQGEVHWLENTGSDHFLHAYLLDAHGSADLKITFVVRLLGGEQFAAISVGDRLSFTVNNATLFDAQTEKSLGPLVISGA